MAEATTSDKFAQVRGFAVEISGAGGKEVDTAWESCTGGAVNVEYGRTNTPGHKYVDTLTLRGPLTAGRKALCQWMNEAATWRAGRPRDPGPRRTVRVTEILADGSQGRTVTYLDCFLVGYSLTPLATGTTGNVMEEVAIKPIRLELQ